MGKAKKFTKRFIEDVPPEKLKNFHDPNPTYTLYKNHDFRLDVQNITHGKPRCFNIQVQVNSGTGISTLTDLTKSATCGTSVTRALVPIDGSWGAEKVRQELIKNIWI